MLVYMYQVLMVLQDRLLPVLPELPVLLKFQNYHQILVLLRPHPIQMFLRYPLIR
jgi:hypothetical protein